MRSAVSQMCAQRSPEEKIKGVWHQMSGSLPEASSGVRSAQSDGLE